MFSLASSRCSSQGFSGVQSLLSGEDASASHSLDLLLGPAGEETGFDDDGLLGQHSLAQHLRYSGTVVNILNDYRIASLKLFCLKCLCVLDCVRYGGPEQVEHI